ncbi:MAG: NUDIX domain-containing protein [Desulfovibrio sp.]|uniref:NUDIX domain-containing protein n=1 Tax=Desulfovibrio sp. 7SRBS1 TaxID=3378064 RepID=UPI003B40A700
MAHKELLCPHCGQTVETYRNPTPTVDILIHDAARGIVLISRKNAPLGWALPGGFIDYGESAEAAAVREAKEETGLDVVLTGLLGVYSDPQRDPRGHTLSVVYTAQALHPETLQAGDDAARAAFYRRGALPSPLAFDHGRMVEDFFATLDKLQR